MTKGILVSCTYQIVTPESAENGDIAESGFEWEDCEYSFKELIDLIEKCYEFSCPVAYATEHTWASVEPYINDYGTGEEKSESYHYSRKNDARMIKYWVKALKTVERLRKERMERMRLSSYQVVSSIAALGGNNSTEDI